MISSDQKAKVIVDLLRGLMEKNDPYDKNESLDACLKAAAMIRLEIKRIDINYDNVARLVSAANFAMFSRIAEWKEAR